LIWEPEFAEVAASGDLGYTTGPWEYRPAPERNQPTSYGHFNSIWKREASGGWRVVVDIGGEHPKPERGVGSTQFSRGAALHVTPDAAQARSPRTDLSSLDRDFSSATHAKGIHAALAARAAADIRLNTEGALPTIGVTDARSRAAAIEGSFNFLTRGSDLAGSDDLGYTYGIAQHRLEHASAIADSSTYLHVWRRGPDHRWKLALAVWNPLRR
jgi:ketosteroid isomerase-like protein